MQNILRTIWSIYTFIVLAFVVIYTSIIVFIATLLFGKKAKKFCLQVCEHFSCPIICFGSGIFLKKIGRNHIKKGEGYVIICNHNSNYDIFINSACYPAHSVFTFLSKIELAKVPFFGIIAKNLAVLVDRSSMSSRRHSFKYMEEVLKEGISICIYPEGTRNKTDEDLLDFQIGAFKLAIDMKIPILVNTLVGVKKINNPNRAMDMWPGVVYSYFEEPINTENMTAADIRGLKETIINTMKMRINAHK